MYVSESWCFAVDIETGIQPGNREDGKSRTSAARGWTLDFSVCARLVEFSDCSGLPPLLIVS